MMNTKNLKSACIRYASACWQACTNRLKTWR